jgi:predicted PhzF superfamily epimerase YddE/YHI9
MTSRTLTTTVAGRAGSMRRQRRRTAAAGRIYCRTNGCTSFLQEDPATGVARCPVCGYTRRNR